MRNMLLSEVAQLIRERQPFECPDIRGVVRNDLKARTYYVTFTSTKSLYAVGAVYTNGEWFTLPEAEAAKCYGIYVGSTYERWRLIRDCVPDAREVGEYQTLINLAYYGLEEAIRRMVS